MDQGSTAAAGGNLAFTLIADEQIDMPPTQDLRAALEKGTDEVKLDTLRRIIVSTLNGSPHVRYPLVTPTTLGVHDDTDIPYHAYRSQPFSCPSFSSFYLQRINILRNYYSTSSLLVTAPCDYDLTLRYDD